MLFNTIKSKSPSIFITRTFGILIKAILILFTTCVITVILTPEIWRENTALIHSTLELVCVFIAVSIFVVMWYTFENNTINNRPANCCQYILNNFFKKLLL